MSWNAIKKTLLDTMAFAVLSLILAVVIFLIFIPFGILYYHNHYILAYICLDFEMLLALFLFLLVQNID